jgi:hydrogenase/urease accessory protein HupE
MPRRLAIRALCLLGVLLAVAAGPAARADIFRPAYLQLTELEDNRYAVLWRVPALPDRRRLAARILWPQTVQPEGEARSALFDNSWEERLLIHAPEGLIGQEIVIDGLIGGATDVIVRIERRDGTTQLERLAPSSPRFVVTASPGPGEVAWDYLILGVEHILGGIDHLLFVLALLLLVRNLRRLFLTITAFTVAHSLTLVAATLGWVSLPGPPVEAVIALSIVFVAAEVIHEQQGRASLTARAPWIVAFGFGLLHGFGFAGALEEVGLPETAIPVALLMFNVGVEVGQLLFVAALVALAALLRRFTALSLAGVSRLVAYAIGTVAAFWTIERVAAFVP